MREKETTGPRLVYRIGMGVRGADQNWKRLLNRLIQENQPAINKILLDYGVPLLDENDRPIGAETALLLADGLSLWALFRGIGSGFPAHRAVMGFVVAQLLAQVVVIPGTLEVGLAGLLAGFGAHAGTAVLVAILFHLLALWLPMPLGWWFYRNAESKRSSSYRSRRSAASPRP